MVAVYPSPLRPFASDGNFAHLECGNGTGQEEPRALSGRGRNRSRVKPPTIHGFEQNQKTHIPHINFTYVTYVYNYLFLVEHVSWTCHHGYCEHHYFFHHHNHHHPRCSKLTASKFDLPSLIRCRDLATSRARLKICDSKTFGSLGGSHVPSGWLIVGVVSVPGIQGSEPSC